MDTMETPDTTLQHKIDHMAEFMDITQDNEWQPHKRWDHLMMVYEKVCQWVRTSDENPNRDKHLVYVDQFDVGTNKIFISLYCIQPDGKFGFTNIFHGHSRLEDVEGDCDSTKEMFFKSLSDFVTTVKYTQELYGE